ncbi:MAG TPA: tripartite tricarboxylate transporter substrate binding protein [Burkholderiales bacterium]|nr:tripartite tricarboxylate transporter substrate binding protein [Burkholderiales bacterium]
MHRTMRTLLLFVAFVFALGAHAQQYPNHPIKLIVPWPPGGAVDIIGRLVADSITGPLGQPVVVDNRGGAAGAIGSDIAAKSPPDGYTLLMGSTTVISINPALQKLPYAPTDFAPITMVAFVPHILVIPAEVPANNLKEFVAWVKANPGKVSYASAGPGTPHHIAGEMFKSLAGVEMLQVPYKGTGPALIDLMANRVQFMSVEAVAALPHVRSGKLKALGVATPQRNALAPDIPTVAEAGLPGFEVTAWYGVVAPVGVPQPAADLLAKTVSNALESATFREKLAGMGATPVGGTPEQFGALLKVENAKWAKAIKDANIHLD